MLEIVHVNFIMNGFRLWANFLYDSFVWQLIANCRHCVFNGIRVFSSVYDKDIILSQILI